MKSKSQAIRRYKSATEKMKTCSFAIFCEAFGEYKCEASHRAIMNAELECVGCKHHVRRSSDEEKKICHCEACMKRQTFEESEDGVS